MLVIITSHPIQYQAPLWRELAVDGRVRFEVWFLTPHAVHHTYDREFGREFAWDIDLLQGYPHRFLEVDAGWRLDRFNGIRLRRRWSEEFAAHGVTTVWVEGWRFRTLWQAVSTACRQGLQVWLRGENSDLAPESGTRLIWKRLLLRWLFRRVDRFLAIGSANRRFYLRHRVNPQQIFPAPYGVDNDRFSAAAASLRPRRGEWRARWRIAPDSFCVLFCGKFIAKKRPLDLVDAANSAAEIAGRPIHLLYAGDGELAQVLRDRLALPGAPPATVLGFVNQRELPTAYAAADCLVLPSDYGETWGLVVNEALASGVPAIVSNRCGCAEDLAAPLGAAHVYPSGDIAALARALGEVAQHPPTAETMQTVVDAHALRHTIATVVRLSEPRGSADLD
jgi:glycosyltransferase involved in cell wall biosynthesis